MRRLALLVIGASGIAFAVGAAETADIAAVVKARQAGYKQIGAHMKKLGEMAKSGTVDATAATAEAKGVYDLAVKIPDWFPKGSGPESGVDTHAKAEIWTDNDGFLKAQKNLVSASQGLIDAAKTGDAEKLGGALKATGETCGACHKVYKSKD